MSIFTPGNVSFYVMIIILIAVVIPIIIITIVVVSVISAKKRKNIKFNAVEYHIPNDVATYQMPVQPEHKQTEIIDEQVMDDLHSSSDQDLDDILSDLSWLN